MIKLYGNGPSRWVKPYWLLKELDLPFEPVPISINKGEHKSVEYRKINPFGKVPALVDGPVHLFESTAICHYIASKVPESELLPQGQERALYDQWMSFVVTELEQPLWRIIKHRFGYPEIKRIPADIDLAAEDFAQICSILVTQMPGPYLVAGRFTLADIAMSYTLKWATLPSMPAGMLDNFPSLQQYMDRHCQRSAFPNEVY